MKKAAITISLEKTGVCAKNHHEIRLDNLLAAGFTLGCSAANLVRSLSMGEFILPGAAEPAVNKIHFRQLRPDARGLCFIFLHGSGGMPTDLQPLADQIAREQTCLLLRGTEPLGNGFTYFSRNNDQTINRESVTSNAIMINQFVTQAIAKATLRGRPMLVAFSAGAIMADAMLRANPDQYSGAVLMRPLSADPANAVPAAMKDKPVLMLGGESDDRRRPEDIKLIGSQYKTAGAKVTAQILPTGHGLHANEPALIGKWLAANFGKKQQAAKA